MKTLSKFELLKEGTTVLALVYVTRVGTRVVAMALSEDGTAMSSDAFNAIAAVFLGECVGRSTKKLTRDEEPAREVTLADL